MPGDVTGSLIYDARTGRLRLPRGPGVHEPAARRRDQPHAAEDAVGAARGDGGAAGLGRRPAAAAARPVLRDRHPEPGRVRGHLPAARGAARPVPAQGDDAAARPRRPSCGCWPRTPAGFDPRDLAAAGVRAGRRRRRPRRRRRGRCAPCASIRRCSATSSSSPARPARPRRCRWVSRRAAPPRCSPRPGPGPGCPAATSSPPTTCRRWPARRSGTASRCGPEAELEGVTVDGVLENVLGLGPRPALAAVVLTGRFVALAAGSACCARRARPRRRWRCSRSCSSCVIGVDLALAAARSPTCAASRAASAPVRLGETGRRPT